MHHLVIGEFVFSVADKTPLKQFVRVTQGAFKPVALIDSARSEFVGQPLETINLSAKWLKVTTADHVGAIRALVNTPQQVSDGAGRNLKKWTIKQLKEGRTHLIHDGQAMVTDVTLQLEEYRE